MIRHHLIQVEARRLRLFPLVGQGLLGGADPGVKNGSAAAAPSSCPLGHRPLGGCPQGQTHPSGLVFGHVLEVHEAYTLADNSKIKLE